MRKILSDYYIKGEGVEIGALHKPLDVNKNTKVTYIDRLDKKTLREHYPELNGLEFHVDVVDNGELLHTIENNSQDFIIANHFIEHCKNPIGTIDNHLSKIKTGGFLYYAIPDKDYTFDKQRYLTSFEHLLTDDILEHDKECKEDFEHYKEYATRFKELTKEQQLERAKKLFDMDYSIHYHVWSFNSFLDVLQKIGLFLNHKIKVECIVRTGVEFIVIIKKL
jgi:predicted SAM-dependent methyltransferase